MAVTNAFGFLILCVVITFVYHMVTGTYYPVAS